LEPNTQGKSLRDWRVWLANGAYRSGTLALARAMSRKFELPGPSGSLRRVSAPKFLILAYHRVGLGGVPYYSELPQRVFEQQISYLKRNYGIISLDQLCDELQNPQAADQSIAVTFDDGYADLYDQAFPVLQKYQIPATVYLPAKLIDAGEVGWYDRLFVAMQVAPGSEFTIEMEKTRTFELKSVEDRFYAAVAMVKFCRAISDDQRMRFCNEIESRIAIPAGQVRGRLLNWEQIGTMQKAGINFASHTSTHPVMSRLRPEQVKLELSESKELLEKRVGREVVHFAYPFGKNADCGEPPNQLFRECGYRSAATTVIGANSPGVNPFYLRRHQIGEGTSLALFAMRIAQLFLEPGATDPNSAEAKLVLDQVSRETIHA
jgi:peptidoglycan/xylan/chitin deacetylase (PgdA/CDA1 family)